VDYQKLIVAGNTLNDAKIQKSKSGEVTYAIFSVGVGNSANRTTFFPVVVFGKLGDSLVSYLTKGRQVLVEGHVELSNFGRFNVVAERVILGVSVPEKKPVVQVKNNK
jgi:single-stranded DNA-binding protein